MKGEIDKELMRNWLQNIYNANLNADFAYLYIEIERNQIILDTLNALVREDVNFRKPLKVKFVNEPGIDEGGVKKEFFQLLIKQLFDPAYTMFTYSNDSRLYWFNGNTFESTLKFELIGILMGIAIYNQVILDMHFPMACYKKLLNMQPNIKDMYELMPEVAQSLEYILNTDEPDLENLLYQTFTVELDVFGET